MKKSCYLVPSLSVSSITSPTYHELPPHSLSHILNIIIPLELRIMSSPQPRTLRRTQRHLSQILKLVLTKSRNWVLPPDPFPPLWLLHIAADINDIDLAQFALAANRECLNAFLPTDGTTRHVPTGTALHHAAEIGFVDMVQFLLAKRADRHLMDQDGKSPLLVALSCSQEVVQGFERPARRLTPRFHPNGAS